MSQRIDTTFEAEIVELRERLLTLGSLVEQAITSSVRALSERDSALAEQVIRDDRRINRLEIEIDDLCIRMLALRQPAASDLRFVTLALKVVTDLERIGDLAVNVAHRSRELNAEEPLRPYVDIPKLAEVAVGMLRSVLDAFVASDSVKARAVLVRDNDVDDRYRAIEAEVLELMTQDPAFISRAISSLFVAKHLERIADHATNVAEMVIFYVEGKDVRHPHSRKDR